MESVPKVAFCAAQRQPTPEHGQGVRTRFGATLEETHGSSGLPKISGYRWTGLERFSGPGAPRRWHWKLMLDVHMFVPLVSTTVKSVSLLLVSCGRPVVI